MSANLLLSLAEIEQRVCEIASVQLVLPLEKVQPEQALVEDLNCDSLDLMDLIYSLEQAFGFPLPNAPDDPVHRSIYAKPRFRIADLAELVYAQQSVATS